MHNQGVLFYIFHDKKYIGKQKDYLNKLEYELKDFERL